MGLLRRLWTGRFDAEAATARLEACGWFRYVSAAAVPVVRDQVRQSLARLRIPEADWLEDDALPPSTSDRRIYLADAEDLAQGGVHDVLLAMRDALAAEGVVIGAALSERGGRRGPGYELMVNDEWFRVLPAGVPEAAARREAFLRLLEIGNVLLERAGSEARLYGQGEDHDAAAVTLTPTLYEALRKLDVNPGWLPRPAQALRKAGR